MQLRKVIALCGITVLLIFFAFGCSSLQTVSTQDSSTKGISSTDMYSKKKNFKMNRSKTGSVDLTGDYEVEGSSEISDSIDINSSKRNQSAILIKYGGALVLTNSTLKKSGDTNSWEQSDLYGLNSIFAVVEDSSAIISDTSLFSDSKGASAIYANGSESYITVSNTTIHTTGNSSKGLYANDGGIISGKNLNIVTNGSNSATLATGHVESTITVDTADISTTGEESPCIYSTGKINANNVTGIAERSPCAVIEGKNSIALKDSVLTGAGKNGVMFYQSSANTSSEGMAAFTSVDSTLTSSAKGAMFYITNTCAEINLKNTTLSFSSGILIKATGNQTGNWGKKGANGGNMTLTAANQILSGDIICDSISTVSIQLTEKTTLTGTINPSNDGDASISLDFGSKWNVTSDSYVTALMDSDSTLTNIISNGHTIYYDASSDGSKWLNNKTIALSDGGYLTPKK